MNISGRDEDLGAEADSTSPDGDLPSEPEIVSIPVADDPSDVSGIASPSDASNTPDTAPSYYAYDEYLDEHFEPAEIPETLEPIEVTQLGDSFRPSVTTKSSTGTPTPAQQRRRRIRELAYVAIVAVIAGAVSAGIAVAVLDDDPAEVPIATQSTVNVAQASDDPSEVVPGGVEGSFQGDDAFSVQKVYEATRESIVGLVVTPAQTSGLLTGGGNGSGFIVSSDGNIVTNAHVLGILGIRDDFDPNAIRVTAHMYDGTELQAEVIGVDFDRDLAVIDVEGDNFQPLRLGQDTEVKIGEPVVAVGNTLGLESDAPTVTVGIVSALNRTANLQNTRLTRLIQTDAAINRGNSGGPLLNYKGDVIGINSAIIDVGGVGFAIDAGIAAGVIESLQSGVIPPTALLGVRIVNASAMAENAEQLSEEVQVDLTDLPFVPGVEGALVFEVVDGSAAEAGGIRPGDIIVEFDGERISDHQELVDVIRSLIAGDATELKVVRPSSSGSAVTESVSVELGARQ